MKVDWSNLDWLIKNQYKDMNDDELFDTYKETNIICMLKELRLRKLKKIKSKNYE